MLTTLPYYSNVTKSEEILTPHTRPASSPSSSPTTSTPSARTARTPLTWSYGSTSINKLVRMINGNGRRGYNIGLWNCRRGLVTKEKCASTKKVEVQQFIQKKNLHVLCLIESDLHSPVSRVKRLHPLNTGEIEDILGIPGYKIILPKSWQVHGQARVMVYARDDLQVKIRDIGLENCDLPTISCEIGMGREKKTILNFFYREFTSGVSGLAENQYQVERLTRQVKLWKLLSSGTKDVVFMGDANLCAIDWLNENYKYKDLSDIVQEFLVESACSQLVRKYTRSEIIQGGAVSQSCIDHCYTNAPDKVSKPEVVDVGTSDHMGVVITKYTKVARSKPNTVMKRSYKDFKVENFLTDILESDIDKSVTACKDLDHAAKMFEEKFKFILDRHAPIKIFQMRRNYSPYLKEETKLLIEERSILKEEMTRLGDPDLAKEVKRLSKEIAKAIEKDEKDYFETGLDDKVDISTAWRTANELLGNRKNLAPTAIKEVAKDGQIEITRNPKQLATKFNEFFREKVIKLRSKTANRHPTVSPADRLRQWLQKREQPPPPFSLKEIDRKTLRRIMKKMKGSRVHGVDWIDGYSLKVSAPILEDSLLHLVNLSLSQSSFAASWKPQLIQSFHKKKAKDAIENYRPVSHLVQVGMIAEYAAQFQILEHFVKHDLFHHNHHGSLAHHSTATAVIQRFESWLDAADHQELSAVCLLDQSAAYDLL